MSTDGPSLQQRLDEMVDESVRLRMAAALPRPDASTGALLEALLDVRRRLDRVEELLATALQLRGQAVRDLAVVHDTAKDAWDVAAVKQRTSSVRDEYSSAAERAAVANLEVIDLRRVERTAHTNAGLADEAVESIRLRHRGLSDLRQDILAVVKIRQFESAMER